MHFKVLFYLPLVASFALLGNAQEAAVTIEQHRAQVEKWRTEHESKFKSPSGWLALTGHYWLEQGVNSFGSKSSNVIKLPVDAAQGVAGHFGVQGHQVTLKVTDGQALTVDGKPLRQTMLEVDASAPETDCAAKIRIGDRLALQLVRRAGRLAVRVRDAHSPAILNFKGKSWFACDSKYRVSAEYHRFAEPKKVRIVNVKGDEVETSFAGQLSFELVGQKLTLDAIEETTNSLFVIFKDSTCGKESYGAGRFLDVQLEGQAALVTLDFNLAYSPPCAWSPHTLCPMPPKQNHLPVAIPAGERLQKYQ